MYVFKSLNLLQTPENTSFYLYIRLCLCFFLLKKA